MALYVLVVEQLAYLFQIILMIKWMNQELFFSNSFSNIFYAHVNK